MHVVEHLMLQEISSFSMLVRFMMLLIYCRFYDPSIIVARVEFMWLKICPVPLPLYLGELKQVHAPGYFDLVLSYDKLFHFVNHFLVIFGWVHDALPVPASYEEPFSVGHSSIDILRPLEKSDTEDAHNPIVLVDQRIVNLQIDVESYLKNTFCEKVDHIGLI